MGAASALPASRAEYERERRRLQGLRNLAARIAKMEPGKTYTARSFGVLVGMTQDAAKRPLDLAVAQQWVRRFARATARAPGLVAHYVRTEPSLPVIIVPPMYADLERSAARNAGRHCKLWDTLGMGRLPRRARSAEPPRVVPLMTRADYDGGEAEGAG